MHPFGKCSWFCTCGRKFSIQTVGRMQLESICMYVDPQHCSRLPASLYNLSGPGAGNEPASLLDPSELHFDSYTWSGRTLKVDDSCIRPQRSQSRSLNTATPLSFFVPPGLSLQLVPVGVSLSIFVRASFIRVPFSSPGIGRLCLGTARAMASESMA